MDYSPGYFAHHVGDPRFGRSRVPSRPSSNGASAPWQPSLRHGVKTRPIAKNPDGSWRLQRQEDRTPAEQARIDEAVAYIRGLGRGGGWETR